MYDQQKDEIPRYLEHLDKSFVCLWYSACNSLVITISMKQRDKHCLRLLKEDANQSFATPCHNTPSWLIKFDGQLYQMLYINLRRHYKGTLQVPLSVIDLCTVSYRSRGEEHEWLNALSECQTGYCVT